MCIDPYALCNKLAVLHTYYHISALIQQKKVTPSAGSLKPHPPIYPKPQRLCALHVLHKNKFHTKKDYYSYKNDINEIHSTVDIFPVGKVATDPCQHQFSPSVLNLGASRVSPSSSLPADLSLTFLAIPLSCLVSDDP